MRVKIQRLMFLVLLLLGSVVCAHELRFAPLPLEDKKIIHEQFQGLAGYLSEKTGHQLKMVFYRDYAKIIDAFSRNEIDLVYLGPLPYVILRKKFVAQEPVVCFLDTQQEASYTCSLVSFIDSNSKLADVKNAHIGLTQPYSTCGYLAVSQMLGQSGLSLADDGNTFAYAGSHSNAALGVVRGEYDVAGVKTAILNRYSHMGLQAIAESSPFPGFTLVANTNTVTAADITLIRDALLALHPQNSASDRALVSRWGKQFQNGVIAPNKCDYSSVEKALKNMPWPIPGTVQ